MVFPARAVGDNTSISFAENPMPHPEPVLDRPFKVVLISPYELGRQPFALAEPAAWLRAEGFEVVCVDLSQQRLATERLAGAGLVAIHLGMHTATRIAAEALPRIREMAPDAYLCAYGLYAPMNDALMAEPGCRPHPRRRAGAQSAAAGVRAGGRAHAGRESPRPTPAWRKWTS